MRVLILHVSDIHIRGSRDFVLSLGRELVEAVKDVEHSPACIIVAVSGDIAWSGKPEEYLLALEYFNAVVEGLKELFRSNEGASPPIYFAACPGNHDCDFDPESKLRRALLEDVFKDHSLFKEEDTSRVLTGCQDAFFEFVAAFSPQGPNGYPNAYADRYTYELIFRIDDEHSIAFLCCNTACTSKRREDESQLSFPTSTIPSSKPNASAVVSMYHHPDNWLSSPNAREFRSAIGSISDIILSGHEHDSTHSVISREERSRFIHIEGGALQDLQSPGDSSFSALVIDLVEREYTYTRFILDGGSYYRTSSPKWLEFPGNRLRDRQGFPITEHFTCFLRDIGVHLTHRGASAINLDDLFIYPKLRDVITTTIGEHTSFDSSTLHELVNEESKILLVGQERSGRTSLLKTWFRDLYDAGFIPVYVQAKGKDLGSQEAITAAIEDAVRHCYGEEKVEAFRTAPRGTRAIIVDDFDKARIADSQRGEMLREFGKWGDVVVLSGDSIAVNLDEFMLSPALQDYFVLSIEPLRREERDRLVQRWLTLDGSPYENLNAFLHKLHEVSSKVEALIGEKYITPYPIAVLSLLQAVEAFSPLQTSPVGVGSQYDVFVRNHLFIELSSGEINVATSFLGMVAFEMINLGRTWLTVEEEEDVRRHFDQEMGQRIDKVAPLKTLRDKQIYRASNDQLAFYYPYQFYHFAASHLNRQRDDERVKKVLLHMSKELHRGDYANVLLFLASYSVPSEVIDSLVSHAEGVLRNERPETFEDDPPALKGGGLPDLTFHDSGGTDSRRRFIAEDSPSEHDDGNSSFDSQGDPDPASVLGRLNSCLKAIQILGQLLKNNPGSINHKDKVRILEVVTSAAQRGLGLVLDIFEDNKEELFEKLGEMVHRADPRRASEAKAQQTISALNGLLAGVALFHVRHLADAIGSPELDLAIREVLKDEKGSFRGLARLAVELDHKQAFPRAQVKVIQELIGDKHLAGWVLRSLIIRRLAVFPDLPIKDRQKICSELNISYVNQRKKLFLEDQGKGE